MVVTGGVRKYHICRMIKALLLIIEPVRAWERVARARRSVVFIALVYLLPLFGLTSLAEGYGLVRWGKPQPNVERPKQFTVAEATAYEIAQGVISFGIVLVGAMIIKSLGETFQGRHTYTQAFTTVAYGLGPMFMLRVLDGFSGMNPWVTWGVGVFLTMAVLYQGIPRIMLPDPPQAFGLYLMSLILLAIITGLARFVSWWYLRGEFKSVERIISDLARRLTS